MVNKSDAVEIISYAEDNGIDIWLDGGWGVVALLEMETREHNDIDLFIEKIEGERFIDIIKEKGLLKSKKRIQQHPTRFGKIPKTG